MITRLVVQNFQNHVKSILDLVPGVNVVIGNSDNGKSALVRAFSWLLFNRPQGFGFKRTGSDDKALTAVRVVTDAHGSVTRIRSKTKNAYSVGGEEYKALRTDVPTAVNDVLNMSAVNVQAQFAPMFLLGESPSEVAKRLNALVGLDEIDALLSILNAEAVAATTKAKLARLRQDEVEEGIARLRPFRDHEEALEKLQKRAVRHAKLSERADRLAVDVSRVGRAADSLTGCPDMSAAVGDIKRLQAKAQDMDDLRSKAHALASSIDRLASVSTKIKGMREMPDLHPAFDLFEKLHTATEGMLALDRAITNTVAAACMIDRADTHAKRARTALAAYIKDHPTCPLCGAHLSETGESL